MKQPFYALVLASAALTAGGLRTARAAMPVLDAQVARNVANLKDASHADAAAALTQLKQQTALSLEQLQSFGLQSQYVNVLKLDGLQATSKALSADAQPLSGSVSKVTGADALGAKGTDASKGLYEDLTKMKDANGQAMKFNEDRFRKYGAVETLYERYLAETDSYEAQLTKLQDQLTAAMGDLNAAKTEMETLKYQSQVNAINGLINALSTRVNALAQAALVQHAANQNDQAREAEASNQQRLDEQAASFRRLASMLSANPGGSPKSGATPLKP